MNVLVIPEDFRKDQYVLKPIIEAMMTEVGKPRSKVIVCKDPLLGGIDQALNKERINEIISRYKGMVDLFLLCVDRDGNEGRQVRLRDLEVHADELIPAGKCFLAENAWQEIEVWALAGLDLPGEWAWADIRAEINPKELYFEELANQRGLLAEPGEGRKTLGAEAARRYVRIKQLCQEDIAILEAKVRNWLEA